MRTRSPGCGPQARRAVPRQLSSGEIARLLDACEDARDTLCLVLMLQLGLRCCEVANLAWEDVDENRRTVLVHGKGGHERLLPLVDEAVRVLDAYQYATRVVRSGHVVRSLQVDGRGVQPQTVSRLMSRLFARAGVRHVPRDGKSAHACRHTAAGDLLRAGAQLRDVQQILGHQSLATTQVYLPTNVQPLADVMEGRSYMKERDEWQQR